jgi:hypothetical protein
LAPPSKSPAQQQRWRYRNTACSSRDAWTTARGRWIPGRIYLSALILRALSLSAIVKRFANGIEEVSALRPYEILVIVDPRPTDEEVAELLTQLGEQVKGLGADVTKMENWGKRERTPSSRRRPSPRW